MPHISVKPHYVPPIVSDEWLHATAVTTQFAIKMAAREDIAVKLGPGFAKAAGTALYTPSIQIVEIDTSVMLPGADPDSIDPFDDLFAARHGLFMGAVCHEAAHARFSRWVPFDLYETELYTPRKIDVLTILEESRIEYRLTRVVRNAGGFLAHVVLDLIGTDFRVADTPYGQSMGAALTLARVDAGSLSHAEGEMFREALEPALGADILATLRGLWREYHRLPFEEGEPLPHTEMLSIADRWLDALSTLSTDSDPSKGEEADDLSSTGAFSGTPSPSAGGDSLGAGDSPSGSDSDSGTPGESKSDSDEGSSGSGSGEGKKSLSDIAKEAKHARDMADVEKVGDIKRDRAKAQREADIERRRRATKAKDDAFPEVDRGHGDKTGYSMTGTSSFSWRDPSTEERTAAQQLSRKMENVTYTDRRVAKVRQEAPGGRLYSRGVVARDAQRATGQRPTAPAWTVKKRTHTDTPKLRVGVMLDISGSMGAQARIASSLSYIVGNAVDRIGGDFGMVLFGQTAKGVYRPGQKVDKVVQVSPGCGTEAFTKGFNALDGMMELVDASDGGLRVLVLISDGVFVDHRDAKYADATLPMLASKGVIVLHIDVDGITKDARLAEYGARHNNPFEPLVVSRHTDPVKVAAKVGDHLITLVKKHARPAPAA